MQHPVSTCVQFLKTLPLQYSSSFEIALAVDKCGIVFHFALQNQFLFENLSLV